MEKIFSKTNKIDIDFLHKFLERVNIEKPDFEIGPILSITLLTIYTKMVNLENETKEFISNRRKFEYSILALLEYNFIDRLSEFYVIDNEKYKNKEKFKFIGLRKQKKVVYKFQHFEFPKYLLWNKEHYEKEKEKLNK